MTDTPVFDYDLVVWLVTERIVGGETRRYAHGILCKATAPGVKSAVIATRVRDARWRAIRGVGEGSGRYLAARWRPGDYYEEDVEPLTDVFACDEELLSMLREPLRPADWLPEMLAEMRRLNPTIPQTET